MNIKYMKDINDRIFYNAFYFWLYFLFASLSAIYLVTLYNWIEIFALPVDFKFIFFDFTGLNLYFNLGWLFGATCALFYFVGGMVSSINLYNKVKYIYEYNSRIALAHIFNSFLVITAVWIFFYQITWALLFRNNREYIQENS
ncbi:MAG: hypothetical protein ACRCVI_03075 [Mycoplasmoidaceae bacterium]